MRDNDQGKLAFVVPVIFILVILLSSFVLYLLFRRHRRAGRIDAATIITVRVPAPMPRLITAQERRSVIRRDGQSFNQEEREKRRQVVLQSIVTKKVPIDSVHSCDYDTDVQLCDDDEEKGKYNESNNRRMTSRSYSTSTCPICCEHYRIDDFIALSKNLSCTHFFHQECLVNWLMKHDDCPLCRANYFIKSESQMIK